MELKAPFVYFGGKSAVAHIVWNALGDVKSYIEPFCGSCAVLLARPNYDYKRHIETINDKDGMITNVWRALQNALEEVATYCDYPANHIELTARKKVLNKEYNNLLEKLIKNTCYYDARLAGYWIWCICNWIGGGLIDKKITQLTPIPHLSNAGVGINKLSIRDINEYGKNDKLRNWFLELSKRLKYVRIFCGDWTKVCNGNWQDDVGMVGFFIDPPYAENIRRKNIYTIDEDVTNNVRNWCIERGTRKTYRIVLAGYYEEHAELLSHG